MAPLTLTACEQEKAAEHPESAVGRDAKGRFSHGRNGAMHRKLPYLFCAIAISLLCCLCLSACSGQSGTGTGGSGGSKDAEITVSITIDGSKGGYDELVFPDITLQEGASAYDALCACDVTFSGDEGYVSSINGLSEQDKGPTSGWLYSVNGTDATVSCGECILSNGDSVRWYYVTEF